MTNLLCFQTGPRTPCSISQQNCVPASVKNFLVQSETIVISDFAEDSRERFLSTSIDGFLFLSSATKLELRMSEASRRYPVQVTP